MRFALLLAALAPAMAACSDTPADAEIVKLRISGMT
jgi:hypothetical protein